MPPQSWQKMSSWSPWLYFTKITKPATLCLPQRTSSTPPGRVADMMLCLLAQSSLTFCDPVDCSPPGSSVHGDSPGKNTGLGCHALLPCPPIFPTQGLNPGLPHCRWILYHLSYQESPRILEWIAYPFSKGSSQPRSQPRVSCITGRFFTS